MNAVQVELPWSGFARCVTTTKGEKITVDEGDEGVAKLFATLNARCGDSISPETHPGGTAGVRSHVQSELLYIAGQLVALGSELAYEDLLWLYSVYMRRKTMAP